MFAEGKNDLREGAAEVRAGGSAGSHPSDLHSLAGELIVVKAKPTLRGMLAHLRLDARVEPVIALSAHPGSSEPLLSHEQVRSVVGRRPRVYFVSSETVLGSLKEEMGPRLTLRAGGLRIWWPGLRSRSDPEDHPLIFPVEGESSEGLLGEFARVFRLTQPDVRREINRIEETRAMAERETVLANQRAQAAEQGMRDAHRERHEAVLRAEKAEAEAERVEEMGTDQKLHTLINREWRRALTVADRRSHPLYYVLSERFVDAVARRPQMDLERLAWGCAMVACGYGSALKVLAPHPQPSGVAGSAQREREDGAMQWSCRAPGSQRGGAPSMRYWVLPNHAIEFEDLVELDDLES